jgi:hypothetical protein
MLQAPVVTESIGQQPLISVLPPWSVQLLFLMVLGGAVIAGRNMTDSDGSLRAITEAGPDLVRLLRFMVAIKSLLFIGAASAVVWRLKSGISIARFGAYCCLTGMMAVGLCEMWQIKHVGLGALMLHGGLVTSTLLLWQDPSLHQRLAMAVSRRWRTSPRD